MSFSDLFWKLQIFKGSKMHFKKNKFLAIFDTFASNGFLHPLQLLFSQSFVVVDEFFGPVSENSDKNLSESGFRLGPTFLEGVKKCIWKKLFLTHLLLLFVNIFCINFNLYYHEGGPWGPLYGPKGHLLGPRGPPFGAQRAPIRARRAPKPSAGARMRAASAARTF